DVALKVGLAPHALPVPVDRAIRTALGLHGRRADGTLGLLHPGRLTFGTPVAASAIVAAVQAVPGVAWAAVTALKRHFDPAPPQDQTDSPAAGAGAAAAGPPPPPGGRHPPGGAGAGTGRRGGPGRGPGRPARRRRRRAAGGAADRRRPGRPDPRPAQGAFRRLPTRGGPMTGPDHPPDCDCCAGVEVRTPRTVATAPGRTALAY